jgi:cation:H+ antiporter
MLTYTLLFVGGLVVLYLGAEWLIKGAASLALRYGIRPLVVGITVVALGTSMPEFVINFFAALAGDHDLALGNIIGSNICNIALILGFSSMILPLVVTPGTLKKEYPIMMLVMILFYVVALDGVISQVDGALLVTGLIGFFAFIVYDSRRYSPSSPKESRAREAERRQPILKRALIVIGGVILLAVGARMMVFAASSIASDLGVHPVVVGLTVVAIGTSLPELAASVVGAIKNEMDMSLGNVLGSNLLNVLFVVGLVSMIRPLEVDASALRVHFPVMLAFGVLLLPLAWTQYRISRVEGGILLAGFTGYLVYLIAPYL